MAKTSMEQLSQANASLARAKIRYDRAVKKLWSLLGWGETTKVEHAKAAVAAAREDLVAAEWRVNKVKQDSSG